MGITTASILPHLADLIGKNFICKFLPCIYEYIEDVYCLGKNKFHVTSYDENDTFW